MPQPGEKAGATATPERPAPTAPAAPTAPQSASQAIADNEPMPDFFDAAAPSEEDGGTTTEQAKPAEQQPIAEGRDEQGEEAEENATEQDASGRNRVDLVRQQVQQELANYAKKYGLDALDGRLKQMNDLLVARQTTAPTAEQPKAQEATQQQADDLAEFMKMGDDEIPDGKAFKALVGRLTETAKNNHEVRQQLQKTQRELEEAREQLQQTTTTDRTRKFWDEWAKAHPSVATQQEALLNQAHAEILETEPEIDVNSDQYRGALRFAFNRIVKDAEKKAGAVTPIPARAKTPPAPDKAKNGQPPKSAKGAQVQPAIAGSGRAPVNNSPFVEDDDPLPPFFDPDA